MPTQDCRRGWKPGRSSASAPGVRRVDWILDVRLTDGPLYWASLILGLAGAAFLLMPPPPHGPLRWLYRVIAAVAVAFALVATVHWALINLYSVFPENIPDP